MTLTSSLIILALSFSSFASAAVLPRTEHCIPVTPALNEPATSLPGIIGLINSGAWEVNKTPGEPVVNRPGGDGEKFRIIGGLTVNGQPRVQFITEADHTRTITAGTLGRLETAVVGATDVTQIFEIGCASCGPADTPVGDLFGESCFIKPVTPDGGVGNCATNENGQVTELPCTTSTDQLFNLVAL